MKKQTPAPKKRPAAPAKMPTDSGIGIRLQIREMSQNNVAKGMDAMEKKSMVKKSTKNDFALAPGSTDPFKRQNKKGDLVQTKLSKSLNKNIKKAENKKK